MWLDKIKEMKKESDLTTAEIAYLSKIPEPTLEKLFAGKTKDPKLETMRQLVHFFGYSLDDLEDGPLVKKRSPFPVMENGLSQEQLELIRLFGNASPELRAAALAVLRSAEGQSKAQGGASSGE